MVRGIRLASSVIAEIVYGQADQPASSLLASMTARLCNQLQCVIRLRVRS